MLSNLYIIFVLFLLLEGKFSTRNYFQIISDYILNAIIWILKVIIFKWELAFVTETRADVYLGVFLKHSVNSSVWIHMFLSSVFLHLTSKLFSFSWILVSLFSVIKNNDVVNGNICIHWFIFFLYSFNHSTFIKKLHHVKGRPNEYGIKRWIFNILP